MTPTTCQILLKFCNETKTPKWNDGEIHNFLKMVSRTSAGIRRSIHDSYFCGEITDLLWFPPTNITMPSKTDTYSRPRQWNKSNNIWRWVLFDVVFNAVMFLHNATNGKEEMFRTSYRKSPWLKKQNKRMGRERICFRRGGSLESCPLR